MKKKKSLLPLAASLAINVLLVSIFAYKVYHNWFEPGVLKAPFRESVFNAIPVDTAKVYFVGDSHTEAFELNELLHNSDVRNRGIWGDVSSNVLKRMQDVAQRSPKKVFLMIGVNDICGGIEVEEVSANMERIVKLLKSNSPQTQVYVESVLPTNQKILHSQASATERIQLLNERYKLMCKKNKLVYVDLFPHFRQGDGLKKQYSFDGLHLNGNGYLRLAECLEPYVNSELSVNYKKYGFKRI
jgi:lysophospholipase L1-like esterase